MAALIDSIFTCECGAVSFEINGATYSISREGFEEMFVDVPIENSPYFVSKGFACDHCVNHWGLDLCACGSGEAPGECREKFDCCGQPSQSIEEGRNYYRGANSWI